MPAFQGLLLLCMRCIAVCHCIHLPVPSTSASDKHMYLTLLFVYSSGPGKGSIKERVKATVRQVAQALQSSLSHRERTLAAATLDEECAWDGISLASSQEEPRQADYTETNPQSQ